MACSIVPAEILNLGVFARRVKGTEKVTGVNLVSVLVEENKIIVNASNLDSCLQDFHRLIG